MKKLIAYLLSIVVGIINPASQSVSKNLEENPKEIIIEEKFEESSNNIVDTPEIIEDTIEQDVFKDIVISAVGDCTLGRDDRGAYTYSLPYYLEINDYDYSYFFKNVYDILSSDDLSIANFEGTLTDSTKRRDKRFTFKGDYSYTNILKEGSIEAVNLANNHTMDYLEEGYLDTTETLKKENIPYFGNGIYEIMEIEGIKIGLAGIKGWDEATAKKEIDNAKNYFLENEVDFIIYSFHWGVEREYKQNYIQESIAHYAIDYGNAKLILGHHPHVLQGIEEYNGVYIVYSLGNFVFGGNKNPNDKYSMITQINFSFKNNELIASDLEIIPVSITSNMTTNNYQPTPLTREDEELVLKRVLKSSTNFTYEIKE